MKNNKNNFKNNNHINLLIKLWFKFKSKRRVQFVFFGFFMFFSSFAEILSLGAIVPFLAFLTAPEKLLNNNNINHLLILFNIKTEQELLFFVTIFFSISIVFSGIIRMLVLKIQTKLSTSIAGELCLEIYERTLFQNYLTHVSRNTSEVITALNKAHGIAGHTILPVLLIFSSIFSILTIIVALVFIDPLVSIFSFISFSLIYFLISWYNNKRLKSLGFVLNNNSTRVIKSIQESLGGIRDIIIDSNQRKYCNEFSKSNFPLLNAHSDIQFISGSPRYLIEMIGIILISFLSYFLALKEGGIVGALPVLGALVMGTQRLLPLFQQCFSSWATLKGSQPSLEKIIFYLDQEVNSDDYNLDYINKLPFNIFLEGKNISFRYSNDDSFVFERINFKILKGSRIGIIGQTGSGKSTFLDLLMGLIIPTEGFLSIDGIKLDSHELIRWRKNIAHVPQSIFLSDASIEENIAFSSTSSDVDESRVKWAAKCAKISNTIESLNFQYKSNVGERGVKLSGGQRQRIGIARALYKNADVIVFDEATSALDSFTEQEVMDEINSLDKNLTLIIVAHRITTLKDCSVIFELKEGKLLNHNSYEEFIKKHI